MLFALNRLPWYARLPCKWLILGLTVLAVCFPYPNRLVTQIRRLQDPDALIEPDAHALDLFADDLSPILAHAPGPKQALKLIEGYVYHNVPYDWDWNTWGVADYFPTVTETIEKGREDCDGQAIVAASLMRRFGYHAELAADFGHVWVVTAHGELMSPGSRKALVATESGWQLGPGALAAWLSAAGLGIAVFPWPRELIVVAVLWWLMLGRRTTVFRAGLCLALLLFSVWLLRIGGRDAWEPQILMQAAGGLCALGGLAVLRFGSHRRADESPDPSVSVRTYPTEELRL